MLVLYEKWAHIVHIIYSILYIAEIIRVLWYSEHSLYVYT